MTDKIEAISNVNQAKSAEAAEQTGFENFQNFMDTSSSIQPNFEVVDPSKLGFSNLETPHLENQPTYLNEQDVSSNKTGSATDQEQKGKQDSESGSDSDEIASISGIEGAKRKNTISGLSETVTGQGASSVNMDSLKDQYDANADKFEEIKSQLGQVNQAHGEIKPGYQKLLRNHLNHIDDNLKIASSKVGAESPALSIPTVNPNNPIEKFISMLTRSQHEMKNVRASIDEIQASGKSMDPGMMLALQAKTNLISHEVEMFSNLLNKALEGIKTIMNVQV